MSCGSEQHAYVNASGIPFVFGGEKVNSKVSYKLSVVGDRAEAYSSGLDTFSEKSTDFSPELLSRKKRKRDQERD